LIPIIDKALDGDIEETRRLVTDLINQKIDIPCILIANGYNYDGTTTGQNEAKALATDYGWNASTNNGAVSNTDFSTYRNKSKFSALPGGYRDYIGVFIEGGSCGFWWASDQFGPNEAMYRVRCFGATYSTRNTHSKSYGLSIRCIWDN
jgi:uncharacterized protein (TIGR02145 family)